MFILTEPRENLENAPINYYNIVNLIPINYNLNTDNT